MVNNKDNIDNDNTITYVFIGLFSVLLLVGVVCFCVFTYFKWFKVNSYLKINILIIKNYESNYKMNIDSLQIKNKCYYIWNNTICFYDFDIDLVKIFKRESKIDVNIYCI